MRIRTIKLTKLQIEELEIFRDNKERSAVELKRIQAILLINKASDVELLKMITGFSYTYAMDLRTKFISKGLEALKDKKKKKPRALLTEGQRKEIVNMLQNSSPRAFGYSEDYWEIYMLARLIKEQYNVHYKSKTSYYIFFKEAKFTYHKPDKQYKKRDQEAIDNWKKTYFPIIKNFFNEEKTVVLFEDEMMLSTQTTTQKIWLPRGEFPKIDVTSKREIRCVYGFLDLKTGHEHAFKALRANSEETCKILEKIGNVYKNYKIIIVWDNAPWHKSAQVKEFLSKTKHSFYLMQFPPYAPELNPQEHVWKAGRTNVSHNTFIDDIDKATDKFIGFLNDTIFDYKFGD